MTGTDHQTAEIVLPSGNLNETVSFFSDELGFQLESISPADDPVEAIMVGSGLRIRFINNDTIHSGTISITGAKSKNLTARSSPRHPPLGAKRLPRHANHLQPAGGGGDTPPASSIE